jgi:hypothetical protein
MKIDKKVGMPETDSQNASCLHYCSKGSCTSCEERHFFIHRGSTVSAFIEHFATARPCEGLVAHQNITSVHLYYNYVRSHYPKCYEKDEKLKQ